MSRGAIGRQPGCAVSFGTMECFARHEGGYTIRWHSVAAACLLLLSSACINVFDLGTEVKLPIAALDVPESVAPNGRLTVKLTVVTGGCRDFDEVRESRKAGVLILEAWGTDSSGGGSQCATDIRYETHEYSTTGPFSNPLVVSAVQPDGAAITKTVRVE